MLSKVVTTFAVSGVLLFASQSWACGGGGRCCFSAPRTTTYTAPPAFNIAEAVIEVASVDVKKSAFDLLSKDLPHAVSRLAAGSSD
mgnify:CR=1 FL=1